ncbi:MAG: cyclase family protein [Pirellulales bacterium]|nr:cyclase family protein [Pirellulales bacterium]
MWRVVFGPLVLLLILVNVAPAESPLSLEDVVNGKARLVDLTYAINERAPYWPGDNYEPFRLRTIATLEKDGVLSKAFSMPEHLGTHLDAPNHFERNRPSVDQLPPTDLFAPGVVIDVSAQASMDADYQLTIADIERWERAHGAIPTKAVVLLYTGWGRFWDQPARYRNQDVRGVMHFPGYSAEAAQWLIDQCDARGIGIDTLSIDRGVSRDFATHHAVNRAGRYGLENIASLDELPARGFYLVVAPIKIEGGTGGPTRVLAILPNR